MPRRTKLTDFQPMQDEVLRLREENARLRAEIGEAGSPPPLGSWRQRATTAEARVKELERDRAAVDEAYVDAMKRASAAEAKLARVVEALRLLAFVFRGHGYGSEHPDLARAEAALAAAKEE